MPVPLTIAEVLSSSSAESPALAAPDRTTLSFDGLRRLVRDAGLVLNRYGIGCEDRVAIVLANGPEMATAFLAVASVATAAPLNPTYTEEEFNFFMRDLAIKALVVEAGSKSSAREAARRIGVAIIELTPGHEAGTFSLEMTEGSLMRAARPGLAGKNDIALILHTSGTTSRPKIVPLSHANISTSAHNIATTLDFSRSDRGLNIMPLFHIHGLIAGLLAPLSRGASVFCTPGFNALAFFGWLKEAHATWYTAVPTMHQAILTRAAQNLDIIQRFPLRFVRSSSASMPPQVIAKIEATFGTPLIEAYGMTEASHQIASNPLVGTRKPGTVGIAAGPEIAILNEDGSVLPHGEIGEIAIRGENVILGYENNPTANSDAFSSGWFRTGDQGVIDTDGYVRLTGRLKEIIIRGGEKISPREIDEVLMDHPAVHQAVCFAIVHEKLGEEVGAAVVLHVGSTTTERELREFASKRLAPFKVPRKILFLDDIPKGVTGKLQRIGLAEKLGL